MRITRMQHNYPCTPRNPQLFVEKAKASVPFVPFVAKINICRLTAGPVRLARSRTQPFQGCSTGSNPVRDVFLEEALRPTFLERSVYLAADRPVSADQS